MILNGKQIRKGTFIFKILFQKDLKKQQVLFAQNYLAADISRTVCGRLCMENHQYGPQIFYTDDTDGF